MDRSEYRAMQSKLQMTNYARHLKQADRAASHAGVTLAGVVLIFSHGGQDEVHYFGVPWIDEDVAKDVRKAVHGQLGEMLQIDGERTCPAPAPAAPIPNAKDSTGA